MELNKIEDIFSSSKCKVLIRSFQKENKEKPCYILLNEKIDLIFQNSPEEQLYHPKYCNSSQTFGTKYSSFVDDLWFDEAFKLYSKIKKSTKCIPVIGELI